MTAIPEYLIGRLFKSVQVIPVTITAGTGAATNGTAADLATLLTFDEFEIENDAGLEEVSATNAGMKNYIPTKPDFTCTISCLRNADGTSAIDTLASSYSYCKVLVQTSADGTTTGWTDSVLMVIDKRTKRSDVARNVVSISGRPAGVQPYSGTGTPSF